MAEEKMTLIKLLKSHAYELAGNGTLEPRVVGDIERGAVTMEAIRASLAEMLSVYWGAGDGQEPPPACIQNAQRALAMIA